jgi:hypothetical protein
MNAKERNKQLKILKRLLKETKKQKKIFSKILKKATGENSKN